jgi:hypothetical protein
MNPSEERQEPLEPRKLWLPDFLRDNREARVKLGILVPTPLAQKSDLKREQCQEHSG